MNKTAICNWNELPVVLDLHTVALIFNVQDGCIKRWVYDGKIKGFKLGRKWMFNRDYIKNITEGV